MDNAAPESQGTNANEGQDQADGGFRELIQLIKEQNRILEQLQIPHVAGRGDSLDENFEHQVPAVQERWDTLHEFLTHQQDAAAYMAPEDREPEQRQRKRRIIILLFGELLADYGPKPGPESSFDCIEDLLEKCLPIISSSDDVNADFDMHYLREYLPTSSPNIKYVHGPNNIGSSWYVPSNSCAHTI